ncbi:MAG: DUF1156 domain-containing protein [Syntrophaceae bacterium]|nr:DUF1156 domain-containing protein [Syntrophaceae bacterium]
MWKFESFCPASRFVTADKDEARKPPLAILPNDENDNQPIAYLFVRTIKCEGPNCGVEIPLMRSLWLSKSGKNSSGFKVVKNIKSKKVEFEIIQNAKSSDIGEGSIKKGTATCFYCGFTNSNHNVKQQLIKRKGGTKDSRLIAVRQDDPKTKKRTFRLPNENDFKALELASNELSKQIKNHKGDNSLIPDEKYPDSSSAGALSSSVLYGIKTWSDIFTDRQLLSIITFIELLYSIEPQLEGKYSKDFINGLITVFAICINRFADYNSSLCGLNVTGGRGLVHTFGRQTLPLVWDFMETNPFNKVAANWDTGVRVFEEFIENSLFQTNGTAILADSTKHPLPDENVNIFFTDPPYYDAIAYGDLSDFFYVWFKRSIAQIHPNLFSNYLVDKNSEIVSLSKRYPGAYSHKTKEYFELNMGIAMKEGFRIIKPGGLGIIVFAHKSTSGWEAMWNSLINSNWTIISSWPIDTERRGRLNAQETAALVSSIHLVCRPRENPDGSLAEDRIGDWRDVQTELPKRIHEWMPRLAAEGVVGADAIFSCLGPALEIFSRYSREEKPDGAVVTLRDYLERVWAAVSQEALNMVFEGGDAGSLEEDARVTAMWLWTLPIGRQAMTTAQNGTNSQSADDEEDEEATGKPAKTAGYALEYDTARKIAQGLGAKLEALKSVVEIKGDTARLLPVQERAAYLFGSGLKEPARKKRKQETQMTLFEEMMPSEEEITEQQTKLKMKEAGKTVLDRLHQAMLLFAGGRTEALKRFLSEDGAGQDNRFWKLAQALNALYPKNSDERRWVEAVQTYKKSLGF